jgi:type I restriction enzyme, S subunit
MMVRQAHMPNGWRIKSISDVCEVIAGQSPKGKYYNDKGNGLPFFQGKKLFGEKYLGEPNTWTSMITKESFAGDIVMSVRAPVGNVNFNNHSKICIGRGLAGIRASALVDKNYLFYFLINHKNEIVGNTGAVFNSINKTQIETIPIPIPPLDEQKRIVAKLDECFEAIHIARANVEKNLNNTKELFQSQLNQIFSQPVLSEAEGKGGGWVEKKLGEVCDVRDGTHDSPKYINEGIPFVTQKNIKDDGLTFDKVNFIKQEDHDKFYKRSNVAFNDIIISMIGANRGMSCIVDDKRIFSIKNVGLIKANEKMVQKYILFYLKSPIAKKHVLKISKGSAQGFIGLGELRNFSIPIVSLEEQKSIVSKLDELNSQTQSLESNYQQEIAALEELKKSILQKAFNGEL